MAVRVQDTWKAVRLISKSTAGQDANKWICRKMTISRTAGKVNGDEWYKCFFHDIKAIGE